MLVTMSFLRFQLHFPLRFTPMTHATSYKYVNFRSTTAKAASFQDPLLQDPFHKWILIITCPHYLTTAAKPLCFSSSASVTASGIKSGAINQRPGADLTRTDAYLSNRLLRGFNVLFTT
jgi:hypothetical protein